MSSRAIVCGTTAETLAFRRQRERRPRRPLPGHPLTLVPKRDLSICPERGATAEAALRGTRLSQRTRRPGFRSASHEEQGGDAEEGQPGRPVGRWVGRDEEAGDGEHGGDGDRRTGVAAEGNARCDRCGNQGETSDAAETPSLRMRMLSAKSGTRSALVARSVCGVRSPRRECRRRSLAAPRRRCRRRRRSRGAIQLNWAAVPSRPRNSR